MTSNKLPAKVDPGTNNEPRYNDKQLRMFLEEIAGSMSTLNNLLMLAQVSQDCTERDRLIDAAQVMTQSIGCLADHASDEGVIGGIGRWHCGPVFEQAREAT